MVVKGLKIRKAILIFLTTIFSLSSFHTAVRSETQYEQCLKLYKNKFDVPPGFPYCSTNGYPFQQKLWDDLGVIVYGNPELLPFNQGSRNFKAGYADPQQEVDYPNGGGPLAPKHPYFVKNGVRGEYRYLGYDRNGQPYVNPYFIPDMRVRKGSERTWVYRPWSNPLLKNVGNRPTSISPMFRDRFSENIDFIYANGLVDEVNSIIKSQAVHVKYSTFAEDPNKNLFDYIYVTQDPTVWAPGAGTMWSIDHTGKIWYSSHVIDQRKMKYNTPVKAGIEPGPGIEPNYKMEKQIHDTFELPYRVSGRLLDDAYYHNRYDRVKYYTRDDVKSWALTVTVKHPGKSAVTLGTYTGNDLVIDHGRAYAYTDVKIPIRKSDYPEGGTMVITVTAQVTFGDGEKRQDVTSYQQGLGVTPPPATDPPDEPDDPGTPSHPGGGGPPSSDPDPIYCSPNIGDHAIDILPFTDVSETTDLSRVRSVYVTVNGQVVSYEQFFSGQYIFGDDADGLNHVYVEYRLNSGLKCTIDKWVLVHDSKPRAEFDMDGGTWKENRTIFVRNTSSQAVDPYVEARYPIVSHEWSFEVLDGSTGERKMGTDTDLYKELMYTKPGRYQISLTTTNALGRVSDPYVVQFSIIEDVPPAIIQHAYSSEAARGETITFYNHVVSIDGDEIVNEVHRIYYDERGDESYSKLVDTIYGPLTEYTPRHGLGQYKVVTTAEEVFGQPTLTQHLTEDSKRSSTSETYFKVENYIPYADIYADLPYEQAEVEIFFMLDKNLTQAKIDYVNQNVIGITNRFRQESLDPLVKKWDMKTYTYSKSVSTSRNTGSSYPSSTYYYDQEGYSGTLHRYSVSNNPYTTHHTRTETVTETRTSYEYTCSANWPGPPWQLWDVKVCGNNIDNMWYKEVTETITRTIEVPYTITHDNYTGYYSGTVYRHVREPYHTPWESTTSAKYIVYISDDNISELADFTSVTQKSDAQVILAGKSSIRNQAPHDHYIANNGQSIESIIQTVVEKIAALNPPRASMTVLVNQPFTMHTIEIDPEDDPIIQPQTLYVHDPNYYDNPQGRASYAVSEYDANRYQSQLLRNSLDKPGLYTIYRRVRDNPVGKPQYSYYSNEAYMSIAAHRKPIAQAVLDWTYNPATGLYETTWVDQSYDLDHQYRDPQRGIRERKIRFRRNGGEWLYYIPDELTAGSYELEYTVRDIEGAWSDPFKLSFTLAEQPPPQIDAKARAELAKFSLRNIPASEQLRIYEIWTRYPYRHDLEAAIYNSAGTTRMTNPVTVAYHTGTKRGSDIYWEDIVYTIPETLPDGQYVLRLSAVGQNGIRAHIDFPIRVNTPINLVPSLASELLTGEHTDLEAATSKYASSVTVTMFRGTRYENKQELSDTRKSDLKTWHASYLVPEIPDGHYQVRFTAVTPNGNSQSIDRTVEVINNRPPVADFTWSPSTIWEGDTVSFINRSYDPDGDPLTYSWLITHPDGTVYTSNEQHIELRLPQIGNHTVQLTVSDGRFTDTKQAVLAVRELTLSADVHHTDHWYEYHREAGHETEVHPKDYYSGEKFLLSAATSPVPVQRVSAALIAVDREGQPVQVETVLAPVRGSEHYEGELYDESFSSLDQGLAVGLHAVKFQVRYVNGTVKTAEVPIRIIGHVLESAGVHRRQ